MVEVRVKAVVGIWVEIRVEFRVGSASLSE